MFQRPPPANLQFRLLDCGSDNHKNLQSNPTFYQHQFSNSVNGYVSRNLMRQESVENKQRIIFPYQGISFRYPRSFTFEADLDNPDAKHWTLSGNDFKIMFFVLNAPLTPEDFANNMVEQFAVLSVVDQKRLPTPLPIKKRE